MRAGHGQHMARAGWMVQHMFAKPLRPAGVGSAAFEDCLHQRELGAAVGQARAADHVAYDIHVGLQGHLVGAVALDQLDAQCTQLIAHRRVDAGVAACDAVPSLARQRGQSAHEGAADAQNMYVHGRAFYGCRHVWDGWPAKTGACGPAGTGSRKHKVAKSPVQGAGGNMQSPSAAGVAAAWVTMARGHPQGRPLIYM